MSPTINPPDSTADDLNLGLLTIAYPAFRFSLLAHGWRGSRWLAVRKNSADQGLYAAVTADLDELVAALVHDAEQASRQQHAGHDEPGTRP